MLLAKTSNDPSDGSALPTGAQEFAFNARDFERVRALIFQRAGIHLHAGKQAMVYSRLSRRLRETGHQSFAEYLHDLESQSGASNDAEWQVFVNCLTTNLTAFFRENHHFDTLHEALIQHRKAGSNVRIWCSAASTGEEPYSLAMTALEALGANAPVKILASDIDTDVLARAARGVYDAQARGLTPERLRQFCLRGTASNAGMIRIKPELIRMIEFRPFNLMQTHWSLGEAFDYVFCRNVMIYFQAETQREVLRRIHGVMKPGSLLFVGHSENFTDSKDLFVLEGKTVYRRV